jgi:hypothetical protein
MPSVANAVYFEPSSQTLDPPADFEMFVAEHRGLPAPEAARLLVEWVSAYEPQRTSPWAPPRRSAF